MTADHIAAPRRNWALLGRLMLIPACLALIGFPYVMPPRALGPAVSPQSAEAVAPPASAGAVPVVEDLEVKAIAPENAVEINNRIPVSTAPNPAARPFRLEEEGDAAPSFNRALDCLTAAVYYEAASEGADGGRAVAQVVLNRVRHPAFPKTVCDVVFQGSTKVTGCQFTFTCDGALARAPNVAIWERSKKIAHEALLGKVFAPVGHATHYHTQFVVPVWRTELDKIVVLGAHIFYRWSGWWGTPPAFRGGYAPNEPVIAQLALLSPAHAAGAGLPVAAADAPTLTATLAPLDTASRPPGVAAAAEPVRTLRIAIPKGQSADSITALARERCAGARRCTVEAWTDAGAVPASARLTAIDRDTLSFSYAKDEIAKSEQSLWNCREFRDRDIRHCLKVPLLADLRARRDDPPNPSPVPGTLSPNVTSAK